MSVQRHFKMSALNAVIAIRQYIRNHPEADAESAAVSIRRIDADLAANDFEAGLAINEILPPEITFLEITSDLRASLHALIVRHQPWWLRGFPYGRKRLADMLEDEEAQCFRSAGLFEEPPSSAVALWWDQIAKSVRSEIKNSLLLQGRKAEALSFEYEKSRLASLGIVRQPIWMAIDDNGAGYDILSYDLGPVEPINRLIEVKSSTQNPPRMILTRGEWDAAVEFGEAYVFHLWALPNNKLVERKVTDIAPHIPRDQGVGVWANVEIVFAD